MAAASRDHDPLHGRLADQTGLALTTVDAVLELKETFLAIGIDVVGDRRSTKRDRIFQNFFNRNEKLAELLAGNRRCAAAGTNPGAKQRFVGIDISDTTATLRRPKRRASTKRSSLPDASFKIACVCFSTSSFGSQTCKRPVMPRCTIHWALCTRGTMSSASVGIGDEVCGGAAFDCDRSGFDLRLFAGEGARATLSRSNTMCLPILRTAAMRLCSRVAAITDAGDFSGSFFEPSHTDSITSPVTRLASPRAIVSTSGSSGMTAVYCEAGSWYFLGARL